APRQGVVGAQESILHDLLSVEAIVENTVRVVEQTRLEFVDQSLERPLGAMVNGECEVLALRRFQECASSGPAASHTSSNTPGSPRVRGIDENFQEKQGGGRNRPEGAEEGSRW